MSKLRLESLLAALFLLLSLGLFGWFNMSEPSILILHSYDKGYSWVRDVNVGLDRVLTSRHYHYRVRWYYMDTKSHPWHEYKESAGIAARRAIDQMRPDVIIAIDDDAQQFVARYYVDHPDIKIVFAGVNNRAEDYGYDKAHNVTGLLERLPLAALRETLQAAGNFKSLGRPVRLAYIGDKSETVAGDVRQLREFNWSPIQLVDLKLVDTWPQWQATVEELGNKVDAIYLTGYRRLARSDTDKTLVPPKEVVAWTEAHSKVPLISGNGFYAEEGGMLGIGTSPYEQGEVAAQMALDILLRGKRPDQIPIRKSTQFIIAMSESKMKARGFELPKVYEAAARVGDKYYP